MMMFFRARAHCALFPILLCSMLTRTMMQCKHSHSTGIVLSGHSLACTERCTAFTQYICCWRCRLWRASSREFPHWHMWEIYSQRIACRSQSSIARARATILRNWVDIRRRWQRQQFTFNAMSGEYFACWLLEHSRICYNQHQPSKTWFMHFFLDWIELSSWPRFPLAICVCKRSLFNVLEQSFSSKI